MYKVTRDLIKKRQKFSKYLIEKVIVKQIGGGKPNDCFGNACEMIDRTRGIKITSGWIVGKYNKYKNSTEIVQHFWNVDKFGNHFDTTPLISSDVEYVVDSDINSFGQKNYDNVDSCVASSLLFEDGNYVAVDIKDNGNLIFRKIESLDTKNLFTKSTKETEIEEATACGHQSISIKEYMDFLISQDPSFKIYA